MFAKRKTIILFFALIFFVLPQHVYADDAAIHKERENSFFVRTGDVLAYGLPIGAFAYALIINDTDGAKECALTVGSAAALTYSLKYIVGRPRPYQESSERGRSFPSGHTTFAFAGASFIERRYGLGAGIPAYALAAATGYSRVWGKWHYWSDVFTGAAIGTVAGYVFTNRYENIQLDASANASGGYMNLTFRF